tara:strand:+ start:2295 stop:2897 length:603 start_codon:yes stop_codon:yes gene_type:complete
MDYSAFTGETQQNNQKQQAQSSKLQNMDTINLITGIFLLILAVSGNFIAETLGCKTQKLLSENMLAKNIIIILIIYFALGITDDENNTRPDQTMIIALQIWIFFLIFNKMSLSFTVMSFILIASLLVAKNYTDYYTKLDEKKHQEKIITLQKTSTNIFMLNLVVVAVGFILYFRKQYSDYSDDFSMVSFIFGKTTCKSIK